MIDSTQLLSDIVVFSKYAKYEKATKKRENWVEICQRNASMHAKKYPHLTDKIYDIYARFVIPKKVFPSMRSLQFGGAAIENNATRMFNCSYRAIDSIEAFSEGMFLLLGGTGLGISVQKHHVDKLPPIKGPKKLRRKRHIIEDSIMGWADAIKVLIKSYFDGKMEVKFDYSEIREKGVPLKTAGGKAPGPEPLKLAIAHITSILENALADRKAGAKLKPIEAYDIYCRIADAVLAGGIRRSAMITLFSIDDSDMLWSKSGTWWELNPQRGRSNNSVALNRKTVTEEDFARIWEVTKNSGAGEPGFTWSDNLDWGVNPCLHPDSLIETVEGRVRIADIKEGTYVYTMLSNGKLGIGKASAAWKTKENAETLDITTAAGHTIKCTPDHKIYTTNRDWVEAGDLRLGDNLVHLRRRRRGAAYSGVSLTTQPTSEEVMEHRLVYEGVYGELGDQDVHHIDGDTYNNSIDNLESMSHSEHSTVTRYGCPNNHMISGYNEKLGKVGFISTGGNKRKETHPMPDELKSKLANQYSTKVTSIKRGEVTDVYDMTVDGTHNFVADFTVVHNCCEISLRSNSFCNLTTIIVSDIEGQTDLNERARAASFIGTLQAGYTDFHYLNDEWQTVTEEDSLLGVSMTGIASGEVLKYDIKLAASIAVQENIETSKEINILPAKRVTAIKPEGTSSLVAGCSSGIHAYFAPYYVRRMRFNKEEPLFKYLESKLGGSILLEDASEDPEKTAVLLVPIKSPDGSILRGETPLDLLSRVKRFQDDWITGGHIEGDNKNNVSVTVSIKDGEWDSVEEWMWENRESYTGISVIPFDGGTYPQMPFTDSTEEEYNKLISLWEAIDFDIADVIEETNNVKFEAVVACSGGACEVTGV